MKPILWNRLIASLAMQEAPSEAHRSRFLFEPMKHLLRRLHVSVPGKRLGIAVSGGADSVALLRLLCLLQKPLSLELTVLHVDHALRPGSKKDADWVKRLAGSLDLPFVSVRLQKPTPREKSEFGLEAWARTKRLAALSLMAAQENLEAVCLGHHANDQAETILMRLLRGTSLQGLGGLRALKKMNIDGRQLVLWRPLLQIHPAKLHSFLNEIGQDWREDPTNREPCFLRNRIRHELLPLLDQLRSKSLEHICRAGEDVAAAQRLLKRKAERVLIRSTPSTLEIPRRLPLVLLKELLRQWWIRDMNSRSQRFDKALLDRLIDLVKQNKCGRKVEISGISVVRTKDGLAVLPPPIDFEDISILVKPGNSAIISRDTFMCVTEPALAGSDGVWVSPDQCSGPLEWRRRRSGDLFRPSTGGGRKKFSRWLIDQKILKNERDALPLLVCGNEVLWVPGYERSALTSLKWEKGLWFIGRQSPSSP